MTPDLSEDTRERIVEYVLAEVHPDRREGEVVGVAAVEDGLLVGVKVHPRGYLSTAKYALVTLDGERRVIEARECTGGEVRRAVESDEE